MNYLLKSKPKHEHRIKVIAVISLFVFLSLFGYLFPNFTRNTLFFVARPLWSLSSNVTEPFSIIKNYFVLKSKIIKENLALEEELESLRLKELDRVVLAKENQDLKSQLGRESNTNRIISRVLSKPPRSSYDTLVIDVGSVHGIKFDSKVYSEDNVLIGLIKEVTTNTSIVELFSSGNVKQEAVLTRTGASFTLVGRGGANFELEVPKDTDVLWGDVFVYPSLSSSVLGSVYYIDVGSQSSFKTVYVKIPGSVFSVKWVFVE